MEEFGAGLAPLERVLAEERDRRTAAEDIASRVGVSIDLGLLQPLERLPRDGELARAFGVAPITVRRALKQLSEEGIVVRRRGRGGGTFVAEHPPRQRLRSYELERARLSSEILELFDYRLVLELGLTRRITHQATSTDLALLDEIVQEMDRAEGWASFRLLDQHFHLAAARLAGPPSAVAELTRVLGRIGKLYFPYPLDYLHQTNRDHRALVEALRARDLIAALDVVERHVGAAKDAFSWMHNGATPVLDKNDPNAHNRRRESPARAAGMSHR